MFKRLLWLSTGVAFGLGTSYWVTRFVRQKVARYSPERLRGEVSTSLSSLRNDLRAALGEGRAAMREREIELRGSLGDGPRR